MADRIPPIFLATAVQAAVKAGAMQMAGIDNLQVEKKGAIDLVTQIDRDVEKMFRALIAERFPDHVVLAEPPPAQQDADRHLPHHDEPDGPKPGYHPDGRRLRADDPAQQRPPTNLAGAGAVAGSRQRCVIHAGRTAGGRRVRQR